MIIEEADHFSSELVAFRCTKISTEEKATFNGKFLDELGTSTMPSFDRACRCPAVVLGAGNGGHAAAADLPREGHRVNLFEFADFRKNVEPIIERGGTQITGSARVGFAKLNRVTTDIGEALGDVDVMTSTMVANAHKTIAKLSAPYLRDGQAVGEHALLQGWSEGAASAICRSFRTRF